MSLPAAVVVAAVVPEVDLSVVVAAVVVAESGAYLSAVVVEAPPIFPMASTWFHADYSVEFSCHWATLPEFDDCARSSP